MVHERASRWSLLLALGAAPGCATEDDLTFGDPGRVAGGASAEVDEPPPPLPEGCAGDRGGPPGWSAEIYAAILDDPEQGGCSKPTCHGTPEAGGTNGNFIFPTLKPEEAYAALVDYKLPTAKGIVRYVVPRVIGASTLLCNLRAAEDELDSHPYVGPGRAFENGCGSRRMPLIKKSSSHPEALDDGLSVEQIALIGEWIRCGAPLD